MLFTGINFPNFSFPSFFHNFSEFQVIFEFFLKIGVFFGKFLYDLFVHLGLLVTSQVPIGIFDEFCVLCAMQVGFVFREPGKYAKQFDRDQ